MTKRVVIENGDDSDWDLVACNDYMNETMVIPPNRSWETSIHSGVTLTIKEIPSSEDSRKRGVRPMGGTPGGGDKPKDDD